VQHELTPAAFLSQGYALSVAGQGGPIIHSDIQGYFYLTTYSVFTVVLLCAICAADTGPRAGMLLDVLLFEIAMTGRVRAIADPCLLTM